MATKIATATKLPKNTKLKAQKPVTSAKLNKLGSVFEEMTFATFAGLNNKFANTEVADNEVTDVLNVDFDDVGAPTQRNGYTLTHNFGAAKINTIMRYFTATTRKMVVSFGTSLVAYDPVANTSTTITSALNANGARIGSAMDTVHDKLYMVDGNSTDGLMSWDGTTFTTKVGTTANAWTANTAYNLNDRVSNSGNVYVCVVAGTSAASGGPSGTGTSITDNTVTWQYVAASGAAPVGTMVVWYKNHLFIAGDPNNPNRLYMSDQGDPTSWPALNFIDIDDGSGPITGIKQLGDSIVIHKDTGLFVLTGSDPSSYAIVDTFAGYRGAVNQATIVNIPNGQVFLARDGIWLFNGKAMTLLSYKIGGSFDTWNQSQLANAVAFEYDYKYWLSVTEGSAQTANNFTYTYNYEYGWWTKYSIAMASANVVQGSDMYNRPYFSDTAGNVFQADNGTTDNGTAITSMFVSKAYNFDTAAHVKAFKNVYVEAEAQPGNYVLNLTFIQDFGVNQKTIQLPLSYANPTLWGEFKWGQSNWGGSGNVIHTSTNLPGQATYLQFKLQSNGPFTFHGWTVRYKVKAMMTR